MIDVGLLVSMIVAMGLPTFVGRWWPLTTFDEPVNFLDAAIGPAFAGLSVGRLVAVGIDGPSSLGRLSDLLIVRSGVEFWPGVAAAVLFAAWAARCADVPSIVRLADLTPLAMLGYAGYEATCVVRGGCFGPESPLGLQPPGTSITMLPIGMLAASFAGAATVVLRRRRSALSPAVIVTSGLVVVAAVRSTGSIWLPHIGRGLTRQHSTSILVLVTATAWLVALRLTTSHRRRTAPGHEEAGTPA